MRLTPILATLLVVFPAVAFAAADPEGVFEGIKPKRVVVEVFEASPEFVFDNKSQSGGQGVRVGLLWQMPLAPDSFSIRGGYAVFPTTKYGYPVYSPDHKHSKSSLDDFFNFMGDKPVRNGNRTLYGYPKEEFDIIYEPHGFEFGVDASIPIAAQWALGARMSLFMDMSGVPEIHGFQIANAKLKRNTSAIYGITLTKTVSSDVSIGLNYDHAVLTSYVQGDPQPWNESGRYLYGRRDYNMYGVSVNVKLK
jgi:hypothetical protein